MTFLRGIIYGIFLVAILIVGLSAVPLVIANSGVVAPAGSQYSIHIGNSETIEFSIGQPSKLIGTLISSSLISVYVMNSSQFNSHQPFSFPQVTVYALGNASSFSIEATLARSGVYYLVFYSSSFDPQPPIYVHIINALIVQQI